MHRSNEMNAVFRNPNDTLAIDTDSVLRDTMDYRQVPNNSEVLDAEFSAVVAETLPRQQDRVGSAAIKFSSVARPIGTEVPQSIPENAAFKSADTRK